MLNLSQQKLVEDNHKLIYFFLNHYKFAIEEHYGSAAIGLCKAAETWEPLKGTFATWAVSIMRNEIYMDFRKSWKGNPIASFEDEFGEGLTLKDTLGYDYDFSYLEAEELIENILSKVNSKEKEILSLTLQGKNQREISSQINLSQAYISRILAKFKNKYRTG